MKREDKLDEMLKNIYHVQPEREYDIMKKLNNDKMNKIAQGSENISKKNIYIRIGTIAAAFLIVCGFGVKFLADDSDELSQSMSDVTTAATEEINTTIPAIMTEISSETQISEISVSQSNTDIIGAIEETNTTTYESKSEIAVSDPTQPKATEAVPVQTTPAVVTTVTTTATQVESVSLFDKYVAEHTPGEMQIYQLQPKYENVNFFKGITLNMDINQMIDILKAENIPHTVYEDTVGGVYILKLDFNYNGIYATIIFNNELYDITTAELRDEAFMEKMKQSETKNNTKNDSLCTEDVIGTMQEYDINSSLDIDPGFSIHSVALDSDKVVTEIEVWSSQYPIWVVAPMSEDILITMTRREAEKVLDADGVSYSENLNDAGETYIEFTIRNISYKITYGFDGINKMYARLLPKS